MNQAKSFIGSVVVSAVVGMAVAAIPAPAASALASPLTHVAAACQTGTFFSFPSWDACLNHDATTGAPVLDKLDDIWLVAFPLVESMIRAAGYISVAFIIWGGVKYIRSEGNASEMTGAKDTIRNALIGLILCVSSVAVVQYVAGLF
jgi:hypothetical protein